MVEYNPVSGTLFVLSNRQSGPIVVETSITGTLVQTINVACRSNKPAGLAYHPRAMDLGHFVSTSRIEESTTTATQRERRQDLRTHGAPNRTPNKIRRSRRTAAGRRPRSRCPRTKPPSPTSTRPIRTATRSPTRSQAESTTPISRSTRRAACSASPPRPTSRRPATRIRTTSTRSRSPSPRPRRQ